VRGFGILSLALVHIPMFALGLWASRAPFLYEDLTGVNLWIWLATQILVDGKFIVFIAIAFGCSLEISLTSAASSGRFLLAHHLRRMTILFAFGLLHAYLLWYGDMLVTLSICGVAAYLCRPFSCRALVAVAFLCFILGAILQVTVPFGWPGGIAYLPTAPMSFAAVAQETATYRHGWIDQFRHRVSTALTIQTFQLATEAFWRITGLMLVGIVLGRQGALQKIYPRRYLFVSAATLVVASLAVLHEVSPGPVRTDHVLLEWIVRIECRYWGDLLAGLALCAGVLVMTSRGWHFGAVGDVGRASLSNYIAQTLVFTAVFYGHGLGWIGRLDRAEQLAVVMLVWAGQVLASRWWLRHFVAGPVEWLWKSLASGYRLPLRPGRAASGKPPT
jgi:uncharacterized protein